MSDIKYQKGVEMAKSKETERGTLIYETKPDRGFVFRAINLDNGKGDALIQVERDGKTIREFNFPAYKVWNIAAHANDIIESELHKSVDGYIMAGSTGVGNVFGC